MVMEQHLRQFDLNLLLVFHCVMQERSVSRAALALNMSQPALSGALARLRQATGDALFVRSGRSGMQPTPFALQLAQPVAQALGSISQRLRTSDVFDASTSSKHFTLAMLDVAELYFMPQLVAYCSEVAPHVRIAAHAPHASHAAVSGLGSVQEALRQGAVDLAIGAFEDMPQGAMQQLLFEQDFVLIARQGHSQLHLPDGLQASTARKTKPTAASELQPAALAGLRCVLQHQPQGSYAQAQRWLLGAAGSQTAHHYCSSLVTVPFVVAQSDSVALVPMQLAQTYATLLGLRMASVDGLETRLKTYCFWHPQFHQDQASRWLRSSLLQLFGGA